VTITGYNNETQTIGPSSIAANGALNFYQGDADVQEFFDDVPADLGGFGWFGSAIVTSDVPIVMVVDDNNFVTVTATTDSANFTGLRIQQ
jgi:hypothetical protein